MFVIETQKISKSYLLSHQKDVMQGDERKGGNRFWALKDVNLKIKKGDHVGIIGHNGSGKTTLLKIIAGLTNQTSGSVITRGKVAALLDLEAGFHSDLTGKENIFLNGMLMGMARSEIQNKLKKIIEFADIGRFIYEPFYTYSAGMKFRLAFAVSMMREFDILIIDEIFVSGDLGFQKKTLSVLRDLRKKRKLTTILCSQEPILIWGFSDRYIEVNHGIVFERDREYVLNIIRKQNENWRRMFGISRHDIK